MSETRTSISTVRNEIVTLFQIDSSAKWFLLLARIDHGNFSKKYTQTITQHHYQKHYRHPCRPLVSRRAAQINKEGNPRRGHPYLNANMYRYNRISHNSTKYATRKPLPEATHTSNAKSLKRPLVSRTAALNTTQGNPSLAPQRENTSQRQFLTNRTAYIDTKGNPSSTSHSTHGKSLSETTRISQDSATQNLPRDHPHQKLATNRYHNRNKSTHTEVTLPKSNPHTTYTHNLPRTCAGKA